MTSENMIHVPNDIYEQIVDYVKAHGYEQENGNYLNYDCRFCYVQFESKSDKGLIFEVDGWMCISYFRSREMWGIELCGHDLSSCLSCKTWDEDGNEVANDFDGTILNNYC